MLDKVNLRNFKSHAHTSIEAAPITVFIGPNNSGKSSVFQALLCLRQSAVRHIGVLLQPPLRQATSEQQPFLFSQHEIINIGEYGDVARGGEREIGIGLQGSLPDRTLLGQDLSVRVKFDVQVRENRLVKHEGRIGSQLGDIPWSWTELTRNVSQIPLEIAGSVIHFVPNPSFRLIQTAQVTPKLSGSENEADIKALSDLLGGAVIHFLNTFHPIFPLRGFEEWSYPLPEGPAGNVDRLALADRAVALASILAYDRSMEQRLSDWLEDLLRIRIEFKLVPGRRVAVRCFPSSEHASGTSFANEGTGANQIPFILVPIGLTPAGESIFLSEPEAHLHPKAQTALVSLILRIADKERRQFLVETHSEHVLHSILVAVAKGQLARKDLAIYYFENMDGTAQVRRLEVDDRGRVEGGLPGFFEHSLAELSELLDSIK